MAFSSKYAISLYENIAQFANLELKTSHSYTLEAFRELLGVQPGRYKTFGELNKHVVKPAMAEVNALANFSISVLPVKQGKKVVEIRVGWWAKDPATIKLAFDELARPRRARIEGTVEFIAPIASVNRIRRS
jgi:plasmid replication initiation protein